MYHSRIWVFCANEDNAKMFRLDASLGSIHCTHEIRATSSEFDCQLAQEVEFACGFHSNEKIILCGDFRIVNRICRKAADAVRSRIIGIVPRNVLSEPAENIRVLSEAIAQKYAA